MSSTPCLFLRASNWASIHASWGSASWVQAEPHRYWNNCFYMFFNGLCFAGIIIATTPGWTLHLVASGRWSVAGWPVVGGCRYKQNLLDRSAYQPFPDRISGGAIPAGRGSHGSFAELWRSFRGFSGRIFGSHLYRNVRIYRMRKLSKHIWTMSWVHNGLHEFTMYYCVINNILKRYQMAWSLRWISVFDESI